MRKNKPPTLIGGTHWLVLRRCPTPAKHRVEVHRKFETALRGWDGGTRVSPIYSLDGAKPPLLRQEGLKKRASPVRVWLLFCGPLDPSAVRTFEVEFVFLTLGTFNVLMFITSQDASKKAQKAVRDLGVRYELWELVDSELSRVKISAPSRHLKHQIPDRVLYFPSTDALRPTTREYSILIASVIGRAVEYIPDVARELLQFDQLFRNALESSELDEINRQGLLVQANAVISRQCSQMFAGISPIAETECHFWTHSLLGIGIAALALHRFRKYISDILSSAQFEQRLRALSSKKPAPNFLTLNNLDPYWDQDFLFREDAFKGQHDPMKIAPLMTCFSGRDGFRSTEISLSAPLEVITSCNTAAWTLLTATHELSHTVIKPILATILRRIDDTHELRATFTLFAAHIREQQSEFTLLDRIRFWILFAMWRLYEFRSGKSSIESTVEEQAFRLCIETTYSDVNELMTHVFDFLYFYRLDPQLYVDSIWASWGVIPNIQSRVPEYLIRSLCALYAKNLRKKDAFTLSYDLLCECLSKTESKFGEMKYVTEALAHLRAKKEDYISELRVRAVFVQFVKTFLYSERIAAEISKISDPGVGGSPVDTFAIDKNVKNPVKFVEMHSREKNVDAIRSVWILQQLAFGVPNEVS